MDEPINPPTLCQPVGYAHAVLAGQTGTWGARPR